MTKRAKNYYEIRFMTENGDYVFVILILWNLLLEIEGIIF